MNSLNRKSGILLHITSLPGKYGIGSLGRVAYEFVDFLEHAGQKVWQTLPLTTTSENDNFSPYKSPSAFSSNYDLIDLEILKEEGFIDEINLEERYFDRYVDFKRIKKERENILLKAYERVSLIDKKELNRFLDKNKFWIDKYTDFMSLLNINENKNFWDWDKFEVDKNLKNYYIFLEFIFDRQWQNLKRYANSKGIEIFGDIPIYVSANSSDFYFNTKYFLANEDKKPTFIAGVPPDSFSADGQIWGNPLYNWKKMEEDNYLWWKERIKYSFSMFDIVRIDHFRGFDECYMIDSEKRDAKNGFWEKAAGKKFFDEIKKTFGDLNIVVEDLGVITESVEELVKYTNYPNMKVLQFAFETDYNNVHLPHNYTTNSVCYTGTHDNKTLKQWLETEEEYKKNYAKNYLKMTSYEMYTRAFIDACLASVSKIAIIPLQDWMDYGDFARMNTPGSTYGSWTFKFVKNEINDWLAGIIYERTKYYARV